MQAAKQILRKEIKKKLKLMTEQEKLAESQVIIKKLCSHPVYKKSKRISVYLHMKNEVQTCDILADAIGSGKHVYIPKYVGNDMDMVKLDSLEDYDSLPVTSWNIKQPLDEDNTRENACETGGLDLIIVPGLGFSNLGHRLGHGKGYYDTYIDKISKINKPYLIGLAFTVQMCREIPTSAHDRQLDEILTS
ncbi:5-formyltetrahydrofolate cyclo-ligase-like [Clavelina lepadiformis]|uniref:5-formyltetrahydrofolate cyclo-ligase-like n=1 Tax=Clavelina lepadiformis TaxID=159417 RepID=UPI00404345B2